MKFKEIFQSDRFERWTGVLRLFLLWHWFWPAVANSHDSGIHAGDVPKVFLVSGEYLRCMESASVLLEYEVWHLDPQDPAVVSMYLSHLTVKNEVLHPRQTLIKTGGLPSGEQHSLRLRQIVIKVIIECQVS